MSDACVLLLIYLLIFQDLDCGPWDLDTGLSTPSKQQNRRNQQFAFRVLDLLKQLDCTIVGKGKVKTVGSGIDSDALYTSIVQGVMQTLEKSLKIMSSKREGTGLMVIDRRGESWDKQVIASAQSFLFSKLNSQGFPMFERIVESPLVVDSEYYHGVQVADIVCGLLGGVFRWRRCPAISQKYQSIDRRYGTKIDALTRKIGGQHTLWVD